MQRFNRILSSFAKLDRILPRSHFIRIHQAFRVWLTDNPKVKLPKFDPSSNMPAEPVPKVQLPAAPLSDPEKKDSDMPRTRNAPLRRDITPKDKKHKRHRRHITPGKKGTMPGKGINSKALCRFCKPPRSFVDERECIDHLC